MARELGTFDFSANFERKKKGKLDATELVDNFADLLNFTENNYIPNGFTVTVANTTTYNGTEYPRGIYQCIDENNLNLETSWEKIGYNGSTSGSDKNFIYNQNTPSSIWNITHSLSKYPSVTIIDSSGNVVIGDLTYLGLNDVRINFNFPFSGKAIIN